MKKKYLILLIILGLFSTKGYSQETYGKALNLGLGIGYYGHVGRSIPVLHLNYEFNTAKNFTLAPFISLYSYNRDYYHGGKFGDRYYTYHETVIPIGLKGTYYFDDILKAGANWDFYLGASLGFAIVSAGWEDGYTGDRNVYEGTSPLFLALHIGTEYHFNSRIGAFLDLSNGMSTIGIAIH